MMDWLDEFRSIYQASEPVRLSHQTGFVSAEVEQVVSLYGGAFSDPIEGYRAPVETEVKFIVPDDLPRDLQDGVGEFYGDLVLQQPQDPSV